MKLKKRIALLAATLAFAMVVPQVALATDGTTDPNAASSTSTAASETQSPSPSPSATQTPPPEVPDQDKWNGTWGTLTSYYISSGATGTALDTSDLTLEFYFNLPDSNAQAVPDMENAGAMSIELKNNGAFSAQDLKVETVGKHILRVSGLKYTNSGNTRFEAAVTCTGYEGTMNIGENIRELNINTASSEGEGANGEANATGLIIKSSSIGADVVNAGDEFKLSLTVYATASGSKEVNDVVVSVTPATGVTITSGSSTQYIGTMKPGQTKTVSFPMRALPDFTEGVSTVSVAVTGTGVTGTPTTVSVPVRQPDRFEVTRIEIPETMMVGEDGMASIYFVNKGKTAINNLTVQFTGKNVKQENQTQYVGNLAAGTEESADVELSPVAAGAVEGTFTMTYEAPSGDLVTITKDISTVAEEYQDPFAGMDPDMMDPDMPADGMPEENGGLAPWQIALIVVVVIAVAVAVVIVLRKRSAKKKAEQEESDEDF